jgi:hypothetical protein
MRHFVFALAVLVLALSGSPAQAYEPESGAWWNPAESGSGFNLELLDDMLAVTFYGGLPNGQAKWYMAVGRLDGNAYFEADLLGYTNVQAMGQPWTGRPTLEPSYGRLKIVFDPQDNRRATLTWPNGRSMPIQRYEFYFQRPEDTGGVTASTLRMLGEWQFSIDLSESDAVYPYSGDVLVLDNHYRDGGQWYYEGCRPDDAQIGGCSTYALNNHDAVGYFEAPTGLHVTLVKDGIYDGRMWYGLYVMRMGTNDGSGEFTLYPQGGNPDAWDAYPTRSFRSASRTFVQEGVGPAKSGKPGRLSGLAAQLGALGVSMEPGVTKSTLRSTRFDRASLTPLIHTLEARLESR